MICWDTDIQKGQRHHPQTTGKKSIFSYHLIVHISTQHVHIVLLVTWNNLSSEWSLCLKKWLDCLNVISWQGYIRVAEVICAYWLYKCNALNTFVVQKINLKTGMSDNISKGQQSSNLQRTIPYQFSIKLICQKLIWFNPYHMYTVYIYI